MHRFSVLLILLSLGSAPAFADQNGAPHFEDYSCSKDALSALSFVCDGLKSVGVDACTVTGDSCTNASQELFSGLNIEFANPTNIKNWSGFGGTGEAYAIGALCLLKDLKDTPMTSKAEAWKGAVTTETTVGFTSFDPKTLTLEGWHRARACAPVVGCFDGFTQKFTLQSVKTNLASSPEKVGQYQVQSTHALDLTAQGQAQALAVDIHAIEVMTPYGKVKAAPHFGYAKAVGWVLAPYAANNLKSTWKDEIAPPALAAMAVDSRPHMLDLYGRIPGLKHSQIMPGPLPGQGSLVGQRYDPSHGWISQAGLGGRTIPEKGTTWKPPAGVEYPQRPDFSLAFPIEPRSDTERTPNLAMGADVKLDYSPTELLPSWIQKAVDGSGFLTVDFHVWVQPAVATAFSSQLHLLNMEAAAWRGHPQGSPLPPYSPDTFYQAHEFHARAGSSAAAAFKVTAGVDLTIKLEIELVFTTIRETLINIHPRYTFVDFKDAGQDLSKQSAQAGTYTEHFLSTGQLFKTYRQLNGTQSNGVQHLQACLAAPKTTGAPPPPPKVEPGDPEQFVDMVDWPCNICIGAWDTAGTVKKTGEKVSYPAWVQTIYPAQVNNRPAAVRTRCDAIPHVGCLDRCSWNKTTDVLTVVETAQEMFAAGKATGGGARCSAKLAPLPPG